MRRTITPIWIGLAGIAAAWVALLCFSPTVSVADQASEPGQADPPDVVLAGQVRQQGRICDDTVEAHRDEALSRPGTPAWILVCTNATYSIRLRPGLSARIDRISGEP